MKNIKIYVMAHKTYRFPQEKIYIPVQVGAALHEDLGLVRDDTGENISAKNPYYSELTGFYWMWKNGSACDIMGLCHYRRYFLNEKGILLSAQEIEILLENWDVIVSGIATFEGGVSIYEQYEQHHYGKDLDALRESVRRLYPEYLDVYDEVMHGKEMYFGNMLIASKKTVDAYAKWLFDLLFDVEEHIDLSGYDDYNKRVFGFLSERLLMVWIRKNGLRPYSMDIGVFADKAETEAIREQAISMLLSGDQRAVLDYLQQAQEKRPDIFDETSDSERRLQKIYLLAEIMEAEERVGKSSLKMYSTDFYKLQMLFRGMADGIKHLPDDESLYRLVEECRLSAECVIIYINILLEDKAEKIKVCNYFANRYLDHNRIETARIFVAAAMS